MHSDDDESLEELLARGISTYGSAEPRAGFEQRILANLSACEPDPTLRRWRWAIAAPVLVGALVGGVMLQRATHHNADISYSSMHALKDTPPVAVTGRQAVGVEKRLRGIHRQRRHLDANRREPRLEQLPKLDQFPTPSSLTAEERELIAFALEHPKAAGEVIEQSQRLDEPIQIAAIHIKPLNLNDTSDTQAAKKDENEK